MAGHVIFRFRRRAVSTIIGGLIVLSLLLTALGTMIFVSQQYDKYQQLVGQMSQYDGQQFSEKLVINSPGLTRLTTTTISGWGSGCTTTYNCYNVSISNVGGVGVQIARIYINSTGPTGLGCSYSTSYPNLPPCILNPSPTIAPYTFNQANQFLNPGEVNHALILALPIAITLPNPNPASPQNTVSLATTRGNLFSFQWPFQLQIFGQSNAAFSSGIMKIAYQGSTYDSSHDYQGAPGHTSGTFCHNEPLQNYPAASNYAEKLTNINGVTGSTLYFVNPWITQTILSSAVSGNTQLYFYVIVINTGQSAYTINSGTMDLTWYGQNHLDGTLFGVYYNGAFYSSTSIPSIKPGTSYYIIYQLNTSQSRLDLPPPQGGMSSVMFWGAASLTNGSGSNNENQNFFSGTILLSGLWMRASC
ncbi:MAG: hypothetical protein WB661_12975 [Candidatus Bathyarchaeia archaeon]